MDLASRVIVASLLLMGSCEASPPSTDLESPSSAQTISADHAAYLDLCSQSSKRDFRLKLSPDVATTSGHVRASGAAPRFGKDGSYSPPDPDQEVHFWLNIGIDRWLDVVAKGARPDKNPGGNVLYLGHDDPDLCKFDFTFEVPDVSLGPHKVLPIVFSRDGAAPYDDATLEIVRSPNCGRTNIASDEYGTEIHPTSGPPGTEVILSGTTVRGEDWKWAPSDRLEAWWDTEVPAGGIRLARIDDMERCRFETTLSVPNVEPGRYKISVFAWDADPSEGYGLFLPHHFTVTDV